MEPSELIEKLKGDAAHDLAVLSIDELLGRPLNTMLPPEALSEALRKVLSSWLAAPGAVAQLERWLERAVQRLQAERRPLQDLVTADGRAALRALVERPYSPDRRLVLTVIDRGPTRALVRQLLLDAVLEFGRKASAPVAGVARGLGSLAKLAGETVKSRSGGWGSLVGAVSDEVERQLEKRAADFVDAALGGVFSQIADAISDPRRATEAAEMRLAFLEGALELTGPQLARELMNADVAGGARLVRERLSRWIASDASTAQLTAWSQELTQLEAAKTLREVLTEAGVLDAVRDFAIAQLERQIRSITGGPAFAQWLGSVAKPS